MPHDNPQPLINLLHKDLLHARKSRDSLTSEALQSVLAAIDNAGAVPVSTALSTVGTGSTDVPRRELSLWDVQEILQNEIVEMEHAVHAYNTVDTGSTDELNKKIRIVKSYLDPTYRQSNG